METIQTPLKSLLASYDIEITPLRLRVISLFVNNPHRAYTHAEALSVIRAELPTISPSAVASTLRLLKARRIIAGSTSKIDVSKKGRPEASFLYLPVSIL